MNVIKTIGVCVFLLCHAAARGESATTTVNVTDTIRSERGDKAVISYNITRKDRLFTIHLHRALGYLGTEHRSQYREQREISVFLFDQIGTYQGVKFEGENIVAFKPPYGVSYSVSKEGFFDIQEEPSLKFELSPEKKQAIVAIPVHLAYRKKKGTYIIISQCGELRVKLDTNPKTEAPRMNNKPDDYVIDAEPLVEDDPTLQQVKDLQSEICELLEQQTVLPFPEALTSKMKELSEYKYDANTDICKRVEDTEKKYDKKEAELREQAALMANEMEKKQEQLRNEQIMARQDSLRAEETKRAEEEKKQTRWMVIGGCILAVVFFAGNQLLQHLRNAKNQKSMMDMQQSVVRQAENEAKRRAQNLVRNKTQQAVNQTVRKGEQSVRNGINRSGQNNRSKKISI